MLLQIQASNGLAIYDQIVRQIKFAIANQLVRPGERVPSVRELSKQLTINPNTVARAYRQLQDAQILETVRGVGLQVTVNAVDLCRHDRLDLVRDRLRHVLLEARHAGLTDDEVRSLVDHELRSLPGPDS